MWTALLSKELRECGLYAGLALLALVQIVGSGMDLPLIPFLDSGRGQEIPFVPGYERTREVQFTTVAVIAAVVVGLHQTLWESWRQTTLLLLHRPLPRRQIFLAKLTSGGLLLIAITAVPLVIYSLWAATPGTHASPFYWSMTEPWWRSIAAALVCYLGAFLTGLRPAYWLGSRTWPAITAALLALILKFAPIWPLLAYIGLLMLGALLLYSILDVAERREYP